MTKQIFTETIGVATVDGTAVANTTTETIMFPNFTLPANYLAIDRSFRIVIFGKYSTTGTPTLIFTERLGGVTGTVLCKTAACTLPSSVTNAGFMLTVYHTTRSNGSSGTIMANGIAHVFAAVAGTVGSSTGAALDTPMMNGGVVTPAVATADLTIDEPLAITATWSAASASNTLTGLNYYIESLT